MSQILSVKSNGTQSVRQSIIHHTCYMVDAPAAASVVRPTPYPTPCPANSLQEHAAIAAAPAAASAAHAFWMGRNSLNSGGSSSSLYSLSLK
jgi:hypothetical protein